MSSADEPMQSRRLYTRIPFETRVILNTFPDRHECNLIDISLKGALVEREFPWVATIGEACGVSVELAVDGASIHMTGEVAHVEQGRLGVRCTEIDLESMTNLRRLMELNLGDEDALNREIHTLVQGNVQE